MTFDRALGVWMKASAAWTPEDGLCYISVSEEGLRLCGKEIRSFPRINNDVVIVCGDCMLLLDSDGKKVQVTFLFSMNLG